MKKRILGIDPGSCQTGYGLIEFERGHRLIDYGCIRLPKKEPLETRCLILYESLLSLIEKYSPSYIGTETQFVKQNVQSAIKLGIARGMVLLAAAKHGIAYHEFSPSTVKKAVTGKGLASKLQVQQMVKHLLSLREIPQPEDAADALAIAIGLAHQVENLKNMNHVRVY